ncbi:hypothetical protein ABIQ69_11435 [Agromyces sp. G08B096]|uniref:Uncharacterized protein n=1 Tax=Agromyces sp. G08B096 TaxID=3156399 RepID=A0AAU7W636_9MICO
MTDALPDTTTPLTEDERWQRAEDWSDYRKAYGVSADPVIRKSEHLLFCAGWDARRNRDPETHVEGSGRD